MLMPLRDTLALLLTGVLALSAASPAFADPLDVAEQPDRRKVLTDADGKPVLTYEYAHDLDAKGKVTFDTAKVFYHVVAPDGKSTLTKGPGGKFAHHRGIYIGWNKINHDGKRHDLWHVKNTTQKHRAFIEHEPVEGQSTLASRIDWVGTQGKPILEETRSAIVHHDASDAYALIDFTSTLTAAHGKVELNGDPEHAGIQFRPSQKVAHNKSSKYIYPTDDAKAQKYVGLDWVAQTFEIDGQLWTVQHMSHPSNPDQNARWSAYRDYGRFGEFPVFTIENGESATLRYRFRVTKGQAPSREQLNEAYKAYAN